METQGVKKGDKVSVIVYSGHSKEEADAVFNYLNDHYERLPPAPMEGSKLKLKVNSVERRTIPSDTAAELPREEILMKGKLL